MYESKSGEKRLKRFSKPSKKPNVKSKSATQKEPKNYHILGVDVLLDKHCEPHLLEINANPSINILFDNRERFEKSEQRKVKILAFTHFEDANLIFRKGKT